MNSDLYWQLHARINHNLNAKQIRKQLGDEEE